MGGGSSAPTTTTVNQNTSSLPEYARPYFTSVMGQAQAASKVPYTPYEGQRIAGFTDQQQQVQQDVANMQTPGQFGTGTNLATAAGLGSLQAAQYDPSQFSAQQVGQPNLQQYSMEAPEAFGQAQAQQYMSPYAQSVMDIQKREALRDAQKSQLMQNLGAARQGTYGGSRQLLAGMERERNLGTQMGDIQAKGLQAAYENAQQQFERDRAARMGVGKTNLEAALGVQDLGTKTGLQALLANQQYDLEAQKLAEQSRQFGASNALAGYGQAGDMAQTLANLGSAEQQAEAQRLGLQSSTAAQEQALQQQQLDQQYGDFLRQQGYDKEQISWLSNILHGVPISANTTSTETTTGAKVGLGQQIMGAGLGAAGLYNMVKG